MRINADCFAGTEPVFGMLRDGALVFDRNASVLRVIAANKYKVADGRASTFWVEHDGQSAFPEFFEPYFNENLACEAPRERYIADGCRELFDREYPREELKAPKYFGRGLIMCPVCGTIFEPLSFLGIVYCTGRECRFAMNNPFYDPERLRESIEYRKLEGYMLDYANRCYCVKTQRYYPAPPTRWDLWREALAKRYDDWRRRRDQARRRNHKRW